PGVLALEMATYAQVPPVAQEFTDILGRAPRLQSERVSAQVDFLPAVRPPWDEKLAAESRQCVLPVETSGAFKSQARHEKGLLAHPRHLLLRSSRDWIELSPGRDLMAVKIMVFRMSRARQHTITRISRESKATVRRGVAKLSSTSSSASPQNPVWQSTPNG